MSEKLNLFDIFLKGHITGTECQKMIEIIHANMEKFSGNEEVLEKLLNAKMELGDKFSWTHIYDDIFRTPRRYVLDEKNLPTLKMGGSDWCLDFNLQDISNDIAELKPGERIALGRDTSYGNQNNVVKHINVFQKGGFCIGTISRRHCDIFRNEAGKLELIDTSISATRVVHSPKRKGFPAYFKVTEDKAPEISGKTQNLDEDNLPKLKLAFFYEFDLENIADDLEKLKDGKCIAFGRAPTTGTQTNVVKHIEIGKDNEYISRRHCNIWRINGKLVLEDCSTNGTTVLPKSKDCAFIPNLKNFGR